MWRGTCAGRSVRSGELEVGAWLRRGGGGGAVRRQHGRFRQDPAADGRGDWPRRTPRTPSPRSPTSSASPGPPSTATCPAFPPDIHSVSGAVDRRHPVRRAHEYGPNEKVVHTTSQQLDVRSRHHGTESTAVNRCHLDVSGPEAAASIVMRM
jgi:hypothetical protein